MPLLRPQKARAAAPARGRRGWCGAAAWLVVAGALAVAAALGSGQILDVARTAEQRRLGTEAEVVAAYVGKDLASVRDVTASWAARDELSGALSGEQSGRLVGEDARVAERLMQSLRLARGSVGSSFVVDAAGYALANAPRQEQLLGRSFAEREWFRGAVGTGSAYVTGAYRAAIPGRPWVIAAAAPVYAPGLGGPAGGRGRLLGVVGSSVPIAALQQFTADYRGRYGTDITLVAANGAVLTGPHAAETVPDRGVAGPGGERALPSPGGLPLGRFGRAAASAGPTAVLMLDGERVLAARARARGLPYTVVAHRSEADAMAGATRLAGAVRAAGVAAFLLLLGTVLLWRRTIGARRTAHAREQARILALHTASPSGILELDLGGQVSRCNDAVLRLLALDREDVVGRSALDLVHATSPCADPSADRAAVAELVAGVRTTWSSHRLLAHAGGHPVPVQLDWGIVTDEAGVTTSLVCVVTDVTVQHALQVELERARERAEVLWRQAPIGVIEGLPDGTTISANRAFADLLGYTPEELVGIPARSLAAPEVQPEIDASVKRLLGGDSYVTERLYLAKDGRRVPVLTSATTLHDADGRVERLVGFVVDLSVLHAQRKALTEALAEVARQKAFTDAVLETVDVGIVHVDAGGADLTRNRAQRALLGLPATAGPHDDAPQVEMLDADDRVVAPEHHALARALRGEDTGRSEGRIGPPGGPYRDVVLRSSRITDSQGQILGAVVALNDVTAERTALRALAEERAALAKAQRLGRLGSFSVDPATGAWTMSDQLYELWGHPLERPSHAELREQILNHAPEELDAAMAPLRAAGGRVRLSLIVRHAVTGEERNIVSTTEVVLGPDGRPSSITGTHQDITDLTEAERQAQESRAFFEAALVATPDYTLVRELDSGAMLYGTPGKDLLGRSSEQLQALGREGVAALVHPDDAERLRTFDRACAALEDGQVGSVQVRTRHADGSWRWVAHRVTPFRRDADGAVFQVLSVVRDVTELIEAETRLAHSALHDALTGLPNRRLLSDRLTEALERSRDTQRDLAVLYLDLDGFKRVNDGFGHAAGDEVLKVTAERVRAALRPQDTVARVGGDEFVVLLEPVDRPADGAGPDDGTEHLSGLELAESLATRIIASVARPIDVDGIQHGVTASVGVRCVAAGSLADGDTAEQLLADADAAMYDAKTHGKDGFVLFAPGLRSHGEQRRQVERTLRGALALVSDITAGPAVPLPRPGSDSPSGAVLHPVFQPVFDATGELVSFEALCRLTSEHGHPISPELFISVAEETGLVRRLGAFMLDAACAQLAAWRALWCTTTSTSFSRVTMAVNVSALEAQEPGFAERVRATLARHGLGGPDLVLELTETSLLQADHGTLTGLRALRADGVGIAIDDFGTGYASLRYLVLLPVSAVKIDGSFTAGVPDDRSKTRIVHAVSALALDLGLDCVVEGVETEAQRAALPVTAQIQGYLLGRPAAGCDLDLAALVEA